VALCGINQTDKCKVQLCFSPKVLKDTLNAIDTTIWVNSYGN